MSAKRVLIVDDEVHVTHVVSLTLRRAGIDVVTANDGEEAFGLASEGGFDAVLTDFQMPVMSGYELAVKLRSEAATANVPVLMITARGHMLTPAELARTNIKTILAKPFGPRDVLSRVLDLLGTTGAKAA